MHNRIGFNRLGRKSSHRKALHRNMVSSLIEHESIKTTHAKAKEIRRTAEKLVTRAKVDSVHNRRIAAKILFKKDILNILFTEIAPRFITRPGGYTRIVKLGRRFGDAAQMVILEFLQDEHASPDDERTEKRKDKGKDKADTVEAQENTESVALQEKADEQASVMDESSSETDTDSED